MFLFLFLATDVAIAVTVLGAQKVQLRSGAEISDSIFGSDNWMDSASERARLFIGDVLSVLLATGKSMAAKLTRTHALLDDARTRLPKIIWIYWAQGWAEAPYLQRSVLASWQHHNPGWEIRLVDRANLGDYMNTTVFLQRENATRKQAHSDLIRLSLLAAHGGVWADSTMVCMEPLDGWIVDALEPAGVWMYHGCGGHMKCSEGLASWFILAEKSNWLVVTWLSRAEEAWQDLASLKNYYWMDHEFKVLYENNTKFRGIWNQVPYINCEDKGEAACMSGGKINDPVNSKITSRLEKRPHAIKLSSSMHKHPCESDPPDSNGCWVLKKSLGGLWEPEPRSGQDKTNKIRLSDQTNDEDDEDDDVHTKQNMVTNKMNDVLLKKESLVDITATVLGAQEVQLRSGADISDRIVGSDNWMDSAFGRVRLVIGDVLSGVSAIATTGKSMAANPIYDPILNSSYAETAGREHLRDAFSVLGMRDFHEKKAGDSKKVSSGAGDAGMPLKRRPHVLVDLDRPDKARMALLTGY